MQFILNYLKQNKESLFSIFFVQVSKNYSFCSRLQQMEQ